MSAVAEVQSTRPAAVRSRTSPRPICAICSDSMVAAEASAYVSDNVVSYLWSCETCGYGFVTKHALEPRAAD